MALDNKKYPPLEGGDSTKVGGMWNIKDEISSSKFYELLINAELKEDTALDLKNLYKHIKMCRNVVNRLLEELLSDYQSVKRHSEFE